VGNLPPATNVIELKDYFSRDATRDIESVFLISKSNCAFVNYRTEEACLAAMTRFHDSRFKGVRLVCRLRRVPKNAPGEEDESDPAARQQTSVAAAEAVSSPNPSRAQEAGAADAVDAAPGPSGETRDDAARTRKERFFIVKSLTVEDLESSLRHGVWATQKHNEATLNEAYAVGLRASTCLTTLIPSPA
jgi:RNA recognition motif-containing protein